MGHAELDRNVLEELMTEGKTYCFKDMTIFAENRTTTIAEKVSLSEVLSLMAEGFDIELIVINGEKEEIYLSSLINASPISASVGRSAGGGD